MPIQIWNPTPVDMLGLACGMEIRIPAGKRLVLKTTMHASQRVSDEEQLNALMSHLARKGLCVIDLEAPMPVDEQRRISLKALAQFIRENLAYFNDQNMKQATEGLTLLRPTEELKVLEAWLKRLDPDGDDVLVSKAELEKVASNAEQSAISLVNKMQVLLEGGVSGEEIVKELARYQSTQAKVGEMHSGPKRPTPVAAAAPPEQDEPESDNLDSGDPEEDAGEDGGDGQDAPAAALETASGPATDEDIIEPQPNIGRGRGARLRRQPKGRGDGQDAPAAALETASGPATDEDIIEPQPNIGRGRGARLRRQPKGRG